MKVRAPFHVGYTFEFGWELFAYKSMFEWFNVEWDYYFTQRLQSQVERMVLYHECQKELAKRSKLLRQRRGGK
jgi:hypothetical protein